MKRSYLILLLGAAVLVFFNIAIGVAESARVDAETIFLELGPRDPRSLMQGDYMRLVFDVGRRIDRKRPRDARSGTAIVTLDQKRVGRFERLGNDVRNENERTVRWRTKGKRAVVGTDAFHFQEGRAEHFERARYGEFRRAESGQLTLVGLRDGELGRL